jgi:hypothetical protein
MQQYNYKINHNKQPHYIKTRINLALKCCRKIWLSMEVILYITDILQQDVFTRRRTDELPDEKYVGKLTSSS